MNMYIFGNSESARNITLNVPRVPAITFQHIAIQCDTYMFSPNKAIVEKSIVHSNIHSFTLSHMQTHTLVASAPCLAIARPARAHTHTHHTIISPETVCTVRARTRTHVRTENTVPPRSMRKRGGQSERVGSMAGAHLLCVRST